VLENVHTSKELWEPKSTIAIGRACESSKRRGYVGRGGATSNRCSYRHQRQGPTSCRSTKHTPGSVDPRPPRHLQSVKTDQICDLQSRDAIALIDARHEHDDRNGFIPLPKLTTNWNRFTAEVKYFLRADVGIGFAYWYEKLNVTDFATIDANGSVGFTAETGTVRTDYPGGLITGYPEATRGRRPSFRLLSNPGARGYEIKRPQDAQRFRSL
jgi:hypothetical protein